MKATRPTTVLCVDDEKIGLRVRKLMLESHGFKVLTATDGQQGIDLFGQHQVDIVVLDYYMPGLNGGDVAAELRRRRRQSPDYFSLRLFLAARACLGAVQWLHYQGRPA